MRVFIFRELPDSTDPERVHLERVRAVDVRDNATTPEQDVWRQVGRGITLPPGTYHVMRAGRRGIVQEQVNLKTTDLGVVV